MLSSLFSQVGLFVLLGLCLLSPAEGKVGLLEAEDEFIYGTFPDDFIWGFATAAYQIEGAYNEDGKGQNIWDTFSHQNPSPIKDNSTGDVACDSYHKYKEDVQLLKKAGADYYRFSVSWARVLPTGRLADGVNPKGMEYYSNLIDELIANGIEPMITFYHWDLPQTLQDVGGWTNETIVQHFGDYTRLLYGNFGNRVKRWITFNEAWVFCVQGYGDGQHAPGIINISTEPYQCIHNVLKSHGTAYRIYDGEFRAVQQGQVGITLDATWYEPKNASDPADVEAAERTMVFRHGWLAFPIYFGDYPEIMRSTIDFKSVMEGRNESRLPRFDDHWKQVIHGSADFLGLNTYTTELVTPEIRLDQGWFGDKDTQTGQDPEWESTASAWFKVVPWGFRKLLVWINKTYGNPLVLVTENGYSENGDVGLNDTLRSKFFRNYINEMLKAVVLDGCNVKSYTAWSIMDNYEWASGYTERFGSHYVDYSSPNRTRIPKDSVATLRQIFADNGFPAPKPTVLEMKGEEFPLESDEESLEDWDWEDSRRK